MSAFNIGCTYCGKRSIQTIPREWGYSPMTFHLCPQHLANFKAERSVKEI